MHPLFLSILLVSCGIQSNSTTPIPVSVPAMDMSDLARIAAMQEEIELSVSELDKNDEVIEQDGARVLIAPTAQMFLFGTEIDYETSLLESSFKFNNPNVSEACGCGESIKFKNV